jgi:hypothetical protein
MICEDLGYMILYSRSGRSVTLTHHETVDLCHKAEDAGLELPKYIQREFMHDLKLIKFRYDDE